MAKAASVLKVLSDSHLRAIGKVAAEWSLLELTIIIVIAQASKLSTSSAIAMVASNGTGAWLDTINKLLDRDPALAWKVNGFKAIKTNITDLQRERNNIVHAAWAPGTNQLMKPGTVNGLGLPKRGVKLTISIALTSKEMLATASKILKARVALLSWWHLKTTASKLQLLAQGLQNYNNLWPAPSTPKTLPKSLNRPKPAK